MSHCVRMRPMQRQAFEKLYRASDRLVNAPTSSGKSLLMCFVSGRELADEPKRKIVIAVPQTIIAKGFRGARLQHPDGRKSDWKIGVDLCQGSMREKVIEIVEFMVAPPQEGRNVLLCSHTSLSQAYHRIKQKRNALKNTTVWIDEAHHVLVSDKRAEDYAVVCNRLGNLVKYVMDTDRCDKAGIGLCTAFFFRGDRVSIIPGRYMDRFSRYHLRLDEHWRGQIRHIESYRYDFVTYKHNYYEKISELF